MFHKISHTNNETCRLQGYFGGAYTLINHRTKHVGTWRYEESSMQVQANSDGLAPALESICCWPFQNTGWTCPGHLTTTSGIAGVTLSNLSAGLSGLHRSQAS